MKRKIILSPLIIIILSIVFGAGVAGAAIYLGGAGGTGEVNLQKGLVGWWKMDGNAKDSTPYGNDGTIPFVCGTSTVTFTYKGGSVTYGTVSHNGACWLDRNLGATQVATAYNDSAAYGDLFQWGRLDDSHQTRTSGTTNTLSSSDNPGNSNFIYNADSPLDWRSPQNDNLWQGVSGTNNPCPSGWRIPTSTELTTEKTSWSSQDYNGAYASPLKLTAGGYRSAGLGVLTDVGSIGHYWTSSINGVAAWEVVFSSSTASLNAIYRAYGYSARCIKDVILSLPSLTTDRKGQSNKAYSFNGTTDIITIPDSNNWNFGSGDFTIGAWINFTSTAGTYSLIAQYGDSGDNGAFDFAWDSNVLRFFWSTTGSSETRIDGSWSPSAGTWYYVTAVRSGTSIKTYVNNAVIGSGTLSGTIYNSTRNLNIGAYKDGGQLLNGKMSDVRIYNRALSAAEIKASYEAYNSSIQVSNLQKGLIGHWDFNGNAKDSTPYGNNGTVTGATLTTDRKGQTNKAYSFNGTSDYVGIPDSDLWAFGTNPFTIAMWVYNSSTANKSFFTQGNNDDTDMMYFDYQGTGNSRFAINSGGVVQLNFTVPSVALNTWTQVVFVRAGNTAADWNVYYNTVAQDKTLTAGGYGASVGNYTETLRLGCRYSGSACWTFWNGFMDEVRIYNRALSTTEITALYQSYDPGIAVSTLQKGLVGQWKMDGNAKDSTPYGNDGAVTGATLTTDRKGQTNKAYSFNGSSDFITIANESNFDTILNGQSPVSFSAWLKPAALTALGLIFNKGIDPTGSWCYQDTAALACEFKNGDNTNKISVSVSSFFTAGTWTHLVFTYSGSGQAAGIKIYKDGVSQSFTTAADGLSGTVLSNYPLKFASQNSNYYFSGSMDDARIYNRALTQTEVTALYQSY